MRNNVEVSSLRDNGGSCSFSIFNAWASLFSGALGVVFGIIGLLVSGFIFYGALKMKKLESHGLAMAASIVAMIPCFSPCCLVGLPIGIWAVVVLSKPEVKDAFH